MTLNAVTQEDCSSAYTYYVHMVLLLTYLIIHFYLESGMTNILTLARRFSHVNMMKVMMVYIGEGINHNMSNIHKGKLIMTEYVVHTMYI
jgi:hypothetical protein